MKTINETIPEIIAELAQAQALDRSQILKYCERFSSAWRREKDATRARIYRLNKKSKTTNTATESVTGNVTGCVTNTVTESVTQDKEERTEKENLPPTPPIREKGKKEEMPPAAATRASRVHGECPSWEQVKERAEVSLKCRDFDRLPPIIEQIVKKRPQPQRVHCRVVHRKTEKTCSDKAFLRQGGSGAHKSHFAQ